MGVVWPDVLESLLGGEGLDESTAEVVLATVMSGEAAPAQIAAFLVAIRAKGVGPDELTGLVRAMTAAAVPIDIPGPLLDTCGTGGDRAGTFNISTLSAVVVAAAGVTVAKHGNRAASSNCGSADLLEAWGIDLDLPPDAVAATIAEVGIGFLFARTFHPAMRHVGAVRQDLGIPTVFNILGPLCNPAQASHQVVGVADAEVAPVMAETLGRLGRRALVFRGEDGLDELTTTGPSRIWDVADGQVETRIVAPGDFGVATATIEDLQGGDIADNVRIAEAVLSGEVGAPADAVALNAGAALYVAGVADDIDAGVVRAREVLASGAARDLRDRWVEAVARVRGDG